MSLFFCPMSLVDALTTPLASLANRAAAGVPSAVSVSASSVIPSVADCAGTGCSGANGFASAATLALVALPVLGALFLALRPGISERAARRAALVFSFSTLAALAVIGGAAVAAGGAPACRFALGAGALGIQFKLALEGPALLLVALTGIIAPMALAASARVAGARLFGMLFLLMQGAALGVFLAKNFFFWFLFWELSLFPAFFLIKLWGGRDAGRAAYQFVIYTVGGSAFMLLAFAAIYAGAGTWDFGELAALGKSGALTAKLGAPAAWAAFLGIALGLAVKVPLFPFHTWLPSAYAEAPTGVSMFLTAIMAKMGVFGFLTFALFFPAELARAAPWLLALAVAGVVLGAYAALRQTDLKRMVAYSSVNHLGYCLMALFAAGLGTAGADVASVDAALSGAWLQAFNHGLSAAALFFCAGVLADRAGGVRGLGDFGGVRKVAPVFAALCGFSMFSSLGLPGLNGFPGEFMIFRGVFALAPWAAAVATLGLLGTALFLLTFWQKVFHGQAGAHTAAVSDLTLREKLTLAPVVALMVLFGVWPRLLLDAMNWFPPLAGR